MFCTNVTEEFGRLAGTKLNIGKCEGLWLGKDKHFAGKL